MTKSATTVTLLVIASTGLTAQRQTIPQALERYRGDMRAGPSVGSGINGDPESAAYLERFYAGLLGDTDVIVRGRVGAPIRSYLSEDQYDVYTEYAIHNPRYLYLSDVGLSGPPGMNRPTVVGMLGGKITINGLSYTQTHEQLPSLPVGAECLFLLKRVNERFVIANRYTGAFVIEGTRMRPLNVRPRTYPPQYRAGLVDETVEALIREAKRRHLGRAR
jgi:hypothetical protein